MGIAHGNALMAGHLDPGTRMGEILFGLIMTLTFTLGAGLVIEEEGREGARAMLIAILGCNLAWGIIDGVFYVLGQVFERGRLRRVGSRLRGAASDGEAHRLVADEFDEQLEPFTDESVRERLYRSIVERGGARRCRPGLASNARAARAATQAIGPIEARYWK